LVLSAALLFSSNAWAGVFSEDNSTVDLSQAKTFEQYLATGKSEHLQAMLERLSSYKLSGFFEEEIKKIDTPVTLLLIGMMYCPDCKTVTPFLEAITKLNPKIKTSYIVRNDTPGAKEFITAKTGRTNMPAVFVLKNDGTVLEGAYSETPKSVIALLEAAPDDAESNKIWDDFHDGKYDEDVQRDLAELIKNATAGDPGK
jgi:glutaredoxin